MMDEKRFEKLGFDVLGKLERALTDVDDRMEADLAADVLTIAFEDGKKYIVNTQRPARQIWLAAEVRAWHFSYDEVSGKWIEPRDGSELYATLSELLTKKLGKPVQVA